MEAKPEPQLSAEFEKEEKPMETVGSSESLDILAEKNNTEKSIQKSGEKDVVKSIDADIEDGIDDMDEDVEEDDEDGIQKGVDEKGEEADDDGGKEWNNILQEGAAEIISDHKVFYNPVQEFNRDLSIAVLNTYFQLKLRENAAKPKKSAKEEPELAPTEYKPGEKYENGLVILEALGATGLRSIRYAKEVAGIKKIIANDISCQAVRAIEVNIKHNNVEHLVEPKQSDAMSFMYLSSSVDKNFDVIDLDPYGSPVRFLDPALQSIKRGGLLLVTATDMAALAGNTPEAAFAKYGSVPLKIKSCHEMALRILLHAIETTANRHGKYIVPLLSVSVDFYIRVFVRVFFSPHKCKASMSKRSLVFNCTGCDTYTLQPLGVLKSSPTETHPSMIRYGIATGPAVGSKCEHCNHSHHIGGPIWSAPIHDQSFVEDVLWNMKITNADYKTKPRLNGVLTVVQEELQDVPLYYSLDRLCNVLKLQVLPMLKFRSALLHAGYRVSSSHASRMAFKTDAPPSVIWDILRLWNKKFPVEKKRFIEGTPLNAILTKPMNENYRFDLHPDANPISRKLKFKRFQINPTAFWGPGIRGKNMSGPEDRHLSKKVRNQNKRRKQMAEAAPEEPEIVDDSTTTDTDEDL